MALESLGELDKELISLLKKSKLSLIVKHSTVLIDTADKKKAKELIKEYEKSNTPTEKTFTLHYYSFKVPYNLEIFKYHLGYAQHPVNKRKNEVHIHGLSKPTGGVNASTECVLLKSILLYGKEVWQEKEMVAFTPAFQGVVLFDEQNTPLYEILPSNVYVLFEGRDRAGTTIHGDQESGQSLLQLAISLANQSGFPAMEAVYDQMWKEQAPLRTEYEIRTFEAICNNGLEQEIASLKQDQQGVILAISDSQERLFELVRESEEQTKKLAYLEYSSKDAMKEKARKEWHKLKELEEGDAIERVQVLPHSFSFRTGMIYWKPGRRGTTLKCARDGRKKVEVKEPVPLGCFTVTVGIRNYSLSITNEWKTLSYDGNIWHHPHIKEGHLCTGSLTNGLPKFAAQRDFHAIVMVVLRWLGNIDIDDVYGVGIYYWAKDAQKKSKKKLSPVSS